MSALIDQAERDRFVFEQGKNISVIAPAGVGKTTSIVSRIAHLAALPEAEAVDRLPRLIVVTYSVRAAQQMQQKARVAIRAAEVSMRVQRAFQQTFFGTIHSYCVRLLERFGHYLGLPSPVALLENDDELWNRFLTHGLVRRLPPEIHLEELFHFYAPEKLYALGKQVSPGYEVAIGPLPDFQWQPLMAYRDDTLHPATRKSIARAQEAALRWGVAWSNGERFRPLPKCPESDKAVAFARIWKETFAPLHHWLRDAALAFGRNVANAYEAFRLSEAVMTYDDQVRLALRVLQHPAVRRELVSERMSVLLDEAQDTDPRQFEVLRQVAGLGENLSQADDQSFCIVGDFQQAIYAPRSDLGKYRQIHDEISAEPRGTSSRLQLTFRCDQAIIDFVNRIFPSVLNNSGCQCAFEILVARDNAGPGQVARLVCPDQPEQAAGEKIPAAARSRHEAQFVARRLQELGPKGLGADDWSQVGVLCPRKNWLLDIQRELVELNVPVQLHSSNEEQRDSTAVAWLTALIWIATHPEDTFEIAGVLREVFGVSDSDMAAYTNRNGDKLRLDQPVNLGGDPVSIALGNLRDACAGVNSMPSSTAVRQLLEKTHLRDRLNSIAEIESEDERRELDAFLAVIAQRCADGITLTALAEGLHLGLAQVRPGEEEIRDAIQLLTCHKAKGLEWQAVVVPFVFRSIESKSMPYPRVVVGEAGHEIISRDKADFDRQAGAFVTERERQQLQRLLYVTATRAKRTLVLIDDEILFAERVRRPGWPAGELLGFLAKENRGVWRSLPESLLPGNSPASESISALTSREIVAESAALLPSDLTPENVRLAVERAGIFPRRVTPHALATHIRGTKEEAEPETQTEQEENAVPNIADSPGILYGTWWHEFVQVIPWTQPASAWQQFFAQAQQRSPQPERAAREWEIFFNSDLARWLAEPGRLIQVEFPFLWRQTGEPTCLEGVMDLAVYTKSKSEWRVIDWKTNRVGPAGSTELVDIYRGQINAYTRALREMLSVEVRGSLYLTQTGEWVPVE